MRKYLSTGTLGKALTEELLKRKVYVALSQDYDGISEPDYLEGHLIEHNPYLNKDILGKVSFDFENTIYEPATWNCPSNEIVGIKCVGDFMFWGMYAGGDWETPIYFLLYIDHENRLRGFVPDNGQEWRRDTKKAFGNDYADEMYCVHHFNDIEPPDMDIDKIKDCIKARFGLDKEWSFLRI